MKKRFKERKQIEAVCKGKKLAGIIKAICGEKIGSGCYRDVYVLKQNPDYVVKIEREPGAFCNVQEWCNWINCKEWVAFSNWLAPCEMITEDGRVLIQRRVTHGKRKDYPKHIPSFFLDLKVKNFGWIDGRFVCVDYPWLNPGKLKMQYAKWWGSIK